MDGAVIGMLAAVLGLAALSAPGKADKPWLSFEDYPTDALRKAVRYVMQLTVRFEASAP